MIYSTLTLIPFMYFCNEVVSIKHKYWFRHRIGYLLLPLFYLIPLILHLAPFILMPIMPSKYISDDASCDYYRTTADTEWSHKNVYIVLGVEYEIVNLIICILFIRFGPLYDYDMIRTSDEVDLDIMDEVDSDIHDDTNPLNPEVEYFYMNVNMYMGFLQLTIIAGIIIIMMIVQATYNGICLKTNIIVHCSMGLVSWYLIYLLQLWLMNHMNRTKIFNQWQCFKFVLWQEVISPSHSNWFRYRIGYVIIPLIHVGMIMGQYAFTTTIAIMHMYEQWPFFIFFVFASAFSTFINILCVEYTPFYYMDLTIKSEQEIISKNTTGGFLIIQTVSIIITNSVQLFLVTYVDYIFLQLIVPLGSIGIVLMIGTVGYGIKKCCSSN
jgi:hypothetical protein